METENISTENPSRETVTLDKLNSNADKIIFKYSVIASATNILIAIPGTKVLVDIIGDTVAQYKMIKELGLVYQIDDKSFEAGEIIAIIADNMISKKVTTWILDFIPLIGKAVSALYDFAYTFMIGKVFKVLFRTAHLNNKPVDLGLIPELIESIWKEVKAYIFSNWKLILGSQKMVLEKYELDIEKIIDEYEKTGIRKTEAFQKSLELMTDIYNNLKTGIVTKDEFMNELDRIAAEIGVPSPELIKTQIMNAESAGKEVDPALLAILELYKEPFKQE